MLAFCKVQLKLWKMTDVASVKKKIKGSPKERSRVMLFI